MPHQTRDESAAYDVQSKLGKGAFGEVYLVVHKATKTKYVLKKVSLSKQNDWQRRATMREVEIVSSLHNPYVVPYKESWVRHSHTVNVIYGYCAGGDLAAAITKQNGQLFPEELLKAWTAQLLLAFAHIHANGVIHRDVKTQNIFLLGPAADHLQIGDFGLASSVQQTSDDAQHDQSVVGTPHFMSPEMLSSKGYSYDTDVWSLGCVIYECSTLRPPFNAFDMKGLVKKIVQGREPGLSETYSQEWRDLVKSLLRKDPRTRPSVDQLLASPFLASAVAEAIRKGRAMMPDANLPPEPILPAPVPTSPILQAGTASAAASLSAGSTLGTATTTSAPAAACVFALNPSAAAAGGCPAETASKASPIAFGSASSPVLTPCHLVHGAGTMPAAPDSYNVMEGTQTPASETMSPLTKFPQLTTPTTHSPDSHHTPESSVHSSCSSALSSIPGSLISGRTYAACGGGDGFISQDVTLSAAPTTAGKGADVSARPLAFASPPTATNIAIPEFSLASFGRTGHVANPPTPSLHIQPTTSWTDHKVQAVSPVCAPQLKPQQLQFVLTAEAPTPELLLRPSATLASSATPPFGAVASARGPATNPHRCPAEEPQLQATTLRATGSSVLWGSSGAPSEAASDEVQQLVQRQVSELGTVTGSCTLQPAGTTVAENSATAGVHDASASVPTSSPTAAALKQAGARPGTGVQPSHTLVRSSLQKGSDARRATPPADVSVRGAAKIVGARVAQAAAAMMARARSPLQARRASAAVAAAAATTSEATASPSECCTTIRTTNDALTVGIRGTSAAEASPVKSPVKVLARCAPALLSAAAAASAEAAAGAQRQRRASAMPTVGVTHLATCLEAPSTATAAQAVTVAAPTHVAAVTGATAAVKSSTPPWRSPNYQPKAGTLPKPTIAVLAAPSVASAATAATGCEGPGAGESAAQQAPPLSAQVTAAKQSNKIQPASATATAVSALAGDPLLLLPPPMQHVTASTGDKAGPCDLQLSQQATQSHNEEAWQASSTRRRAASLFGTGGELNSTTQAAEPLQSEVAAISLSDGGGTSTGSSVELPTQGGSAFSGLQAHDATVALPILAMSAEANSSAPTSVPTACSTGFNQQLVRDNQLYCSGSLTPSPRAGLSLPQDADIPTLPLASLPDHLHCTQSSEGLQGTAADRLGSTAPAASIDALALTAAAAKAAVAVPATATVVEAGSTSPHGAAAPIGASAVTRSTRASAAAAVAATRMAAARIRKQQAEAAAAFTALRTSSAGSNWSATSTGAATKLGADRSASFSSSGAALAATAAVRPPATAAMGLVAAATAVGRSAARLFTKAPLPTAAKPRTLAAPPAAAVSATATGTASGPITAAPMEHAAVDAAGTVYAASGKPAATKLFCVRPAVPVAPAGTRLATAAATRIAARGCPPRAFDAGNAKSGLDAAVPCAASMPDIMTAAASVGGHDPPTNAPSTEAAKAVLPSAQAVVPGVARGAQATKADVAEALSVRRPRRMSAAPYIPTSRVAAVAAAAQQIARQPVATTTAVSSGLAVAVRQTTHMSSAAPTNATLKSAAAINSHLQANVKQSSAVEPACQNVAMAVPPPPAHKQRATAVPAAQHVGPTITVANIAVCAPALAATAVATVLCPGKAQVGMEASATEQLHALQQAVRRALQLHDSRQFKQAGQVLSAALRGELC